jgi:type II restriction/modification system DNA methylase subunit YeeA
MNKNKIKSYAPAARKAFIQAVTDRAHFWGLTEKGSEPMEEKGDVAIIGGRPYPRKVAQQVERLSEHIQQEGFSHVMEEVAYTWFNRFMALRYMEIHAYLEHGFRVLSNPNGSAVPEILDNAVQVELPGLNRQAVVNLKLDGGKDNELYRMILVAQCNALSDAMPFLFERIDDETELLLPDNLLHANSLISGLVNEIDEADWQEVEIIGWLYQFYISEKKDQVIGKVVKSEDIPAATQLFTPNWIVKYMVQNSLGRMWLATYPNSHLRAKMEYYIEPVEQTDEVKAQLAAITPGSLDPEALSFMDPANGSGHILVEAHDLFKEIYQERGYRSRDIPRIILEKNLYGLDIDDRAAQMAGFAVLMKARKDDRTILQSSNPPKLNIMAIQESDGINVELIADALLKEKTYRVAGYEEIFPDERKQPFLAVKKSPEVRKEDLLDLLDLFRHGKTFGSLIIVPQGIAEILPALKRLVDDNLADGDLFTRQAAMTLRPFVEQAIMLSRQYDCVVANPPYMGSGYFNDELKEFVSKLYAIGKGDLYSCFMLKNISACKDGGFVSMITIPNWMTLTTFEKLRDRITKNLTIDSFLHNGRGVFGSDFGSCVFVIRNLKLPNHRGKFRRLFDKQGSVTGGEELARKFFQKKDYLCTSFDFEKVPGKPIAYWITDDMRRVFEKFPKIGNKARKGLSTGANEKFVRMWNEVNWSTSSIAGGLKWYPMTKGGIFRKWYGNNICLINWHDNGNDIKNYSGAVIRNEKYYFKEGITWNDVSISLFSARYIPPGYICNAVGPMIYGGNIKLQICMLNSKVNAAVLGVLCPTVKFEVGAIALIPVLTERSFDYDSICDNAIELSKKEWDSFETSWDFQSFPWLSSPLKALTIAQSWQNWQTHCTTQIKRMQELETENNRLFIEVYSLQDELTAEVPEEQITLARADREADVKRLISYAIGCTVGRYSLDQPGLIYANSGNVGFDPSRYKTFPTDSDGIIPIPDMDWFPGDAACRFEEFLKVAWSPETLEENLKFVADSLSPKGGETPRETIRRYLSTQFFKDHLQTYKKRPIYWLFSSGKLRAFECLVYLHRYNEATLSRMRNEYVTPLQGKLSARIEFVNKEIDTATATSARNKLQKQLDVLKKKQIELAAFDVLLRHYADLRISLDLDDGVKVNYGKFGALLAEVKAVTGAANKEVLVL